MKALSILFIVIKSFFLKRMPLLLSSPHQPFSLLFARKYTSPAVGGTSGGGINFTSRTKIAIKRYLFAGENSASALELLCDFRKKNRCFKKKQRQSRISRGTPDCFATLRTNSGAVWLKRAFSSQSTIIISPFRRFSHESEVYSLSRRHLLGRYLCVVTPVKHRPGGRPLLQE